MGKGGRVRVAIAARMADVVKVPRSFYYVASSETQGLLAGTMRYFRASDIFGRKFTLSAKEPLGTYSY